MKAIVHKLGIAHDCATSSLMWHVFFFDRDLGALSASIHVLSFTCHGGIMSFQTRSQP